MIAQQEDKTRFPLFSFSTQSYWMDFSPINQSNALEPIYAANGIVMAAEERQCVHTSRALKGGLVSVHDDLDMDHTRHIKGQRARSGSSNGAEFL